MLKNILYRIGSEYVLESKKEFKDNNLAQFVRSSSKEIKKLLPSYSDYLNFKSSPGQHNRWSDVPWIAFLDPNITTSTQNGYYVVYLFSVDKKTVSLCLAQGITSVMDEIGTKKAHEEFSQRAKFMISRIPEGKDFFSRFKSDDQ